MSLLLNTLSRLEGASDLRSIVSYLPNHLWHFHLGAPALLNHLWRSDDWEPLHYWGRERDGPGIEDTKVRRAEPGTGGEDVPNELSVWVC